MTRYIHRFALAIFLGASLALLPACGGGADKKKDGDVKTAETYKCDKCKMEKGAAGDCCGAPMKKIN